MDAGGDVNTLVHELLAAGGGNTPGGNTPGGSQKPPVPQGRNSRPSSREVPKARNPLAPLPTDTRNRRPSSRQRDTGGTPGSYRKVPPVPEAPNSAGSDSRRPLSREQRRRVAAAAEWPPPQSGRRRRRVAAAEWLLSHGPSVGSAPTDLRVVLVAIRLVVVGLDVRLRLLDHLAACGSASRSVGLRVSAPHSKGTEEATQRSRDRDHVTHRSPSPSTKSQGKGAGRLSRR